MTSAFNASKDRSRVISSQVARYNELVNDLNRLSRPSWMPNSMQHVRMEVDELLGLNPDDERWTGLWQQIWSTSWTLSQQPPPFLVDPLVRNGIASILSLARVAEERARIAKEEKNAQLWVAESVDHLHQVLGKIHRTCLYLICLSVILTSSYLSIV
jgi:hypothetical protein